MIDVAMAITFEQAKQLTHGDIIHQIVHGKCKNWKVKGKVKLWKTRPGDISIPVKHGIYSYDHFTHHELYNDKFHLSTECKI